MIDAILRFSVAHRWLVLALAVAVAGLGLYSAARLPIDAVPDITNNQVQINTLAPSLSPAEVEKQVTFPIETALAGIPGLVSTRSLSRNGFSQVTAVFDDDVDIYFARQQVSERLAEAKESMPEGAEPKMGPISTGLGEIAMWSVELVPPGEGAPVVRDGEPGWQPDGSYLTPEGERLRTEVERATYLRTVQDWIVRPQLKGVPGVAGIDAIGGFSKEIQVQPDPTKLSAYGLSLSNLIEALERNNASTGAGYVEHHGESFLVKASGRLSSIEDIEQVVVALVGGRALIEWLDLSPSAPPFADHPLVVALRDAGVFAVEPKQAWTDVARFAAVGIPAVNFGPGDNAQAHQKNEFTSIVKLVTGREIVARWLSGLGRSSEV